MTPIKSKIAFIGQKGIPAEFSGTSGIEFYVQNQALKLAKNNRVTCYVRKWATPKKIKKYKNLILIRLPSINTKHFDAFSHSFISSIHVCFTDNEIVWYQAIGPAFFCFLPKLFGKKIYSTVHGLDWKREKWESWAKIFIKFSEKVMIKFSDQVYVVSQDLKNYYWKKYQLKTILQPPLINSLKHLKPNIITKKYGLRGNDYILYMGRFVPEKRVDWIIKAYQKIKPKRVKLVLAGGSSHSDRYAKNLLTLADNNPNIIFTDYVFREEKDEFLSNCLFFVLPSTLEGSSIALKEILYFNKNCLISDLINQKGLPLKRKNIIFFKANNFENMLLKFKKLLFL